MRIPLFYRNILVYFNELKTLYNFDQAQDILLFNNKEILVDSKTMFIREWFNKGILSIQDLLDNTGQPMSYQEFANKYFCKTNFLQYIYLIRCFDVRYRRIFLPVVLYFDEPEGRVKIQTT